VESARTDIETWMSIYPGPIVEYTGQSEFPRHTHIVWTDASCTLLLASSSPRLQSIYTSLTEPIQKLDYCRYIFMHRFGGVYHDADYTLNLLILEYVPKGVGLVESPYRYNEDVQNSLMTSSPEHPFWINVAEEVGSRSSIRGVLGRTGPKMLSDVFGAEKGEGVEKLDCLLFQRIPHTTDSAFTNVLAREYLGRWAWMKGCGKFGGECEVARHYGRASWTKDAGIM